mmetsp:Transcript_20077/g.44714  ORF Transcript_20077/g.44714 Transcript_20077/m.44714 type:complete len:203 (+) Transcript_20077:397-1005(+)
MHSFYFFVIFQYRCLVCRTEMARAAPVESIKPRPLLNAFSIRSRYVGKSMEDTDSAACIANPLSSKPNLVRYSLIGNCFGLFLFAIGLLWFRNGIEHNNGGYGLRHHVESPVLGTEDINKLILGCVEPKLRNVRVEKWRIGFKGKPSAGIIFAFGFSVWSRHVEEVVRSAADVVFSRADSGLVVVPRYLYGRRGNEAERNTE